MLSWQVVGVCVFAYSYVSTIPSWVNEKKNGVNINKAIWYPATLGFALNVLLGERQRTGHELCHI